jgi:hypothetical protein
MDIVKAPQCSKCLTWKVPHFSEVTSFGESPRWAVIWYCPSYKCYGYEETDEDSQ